MDDDDIGAFALVFFIGVVFSAIIGIFIISPQTDKIMNLGGCKYNFIDNQAACKYHDPNEQRYKLENGSIITIDKQ